MTLQTHEIILLIFGVFMVALSMLADAYGRKGWAEFFIGCAVGIVLVIFCAPDDARADDWTQQDTYRETVYIALDAIDWRQTQDIVRHPNLYETNPVLGLHPTNARINAWFAASMATQIAIAYVLPEKWRAAWQYAGIGLEAVMVGNNKHLGLNVKF